MNLICMQISSFINSSKCDTSPQFDDRREQLNPLRESKFHLHAVIAAPRKTSPIRRKTEEHSRSRFRSALVFRLLRPLAKQSKYFHSLKLLSFQKLRAKLLAASAPSERANIIITSQPSSTQLVLPLLGVIKRRVFLSGSVRVHPESPLVMHIFAAATTFKESVLLCEDRNLPERKYPLS